MRELEKIKRCNNCGRFLGENSFHWLNERKGYKHSDCKRCKLIYDKGYHEENKDRQRDQKKECYSENKEYILEQSNKWREKNKEYYKEYDKEYRKNNKEKIRKYNKKYYQKNKSKADTWNKKYYQEHKKEKKEYVKEYGIKNKEKMQIIYANRRARKKNAIPNNVCMKKVSYIYLLCSKFNGIYGYIKYHVDHIKPISKGGLHHQDNLQILEAKLNMKKSDSYPIKNNEFKGVTYKNLEICNCLIKMLKFQG